MGVAKRDNRQKKPGDIFSKGREKKTNKGKKFVNVLLHKGIPNCKTICRREVLRWMRAHLHFHCRITMKIC